MITLSDFYIQTDGTWSDGLARRGEVARHSAAHGLGLSGSKDKMADSMPRPGPKRRTKIVRTTAIRQRLDLLYIERALRGPAPRPTDMHSALRRSCAPAMVSRELPTDLFELIDRLAATSLSIAPHALTVLSEALMLIAGPRARPRGTVSSKLRRSLPLQHVACEGGLDQLVKMLAVCRSETLGLSGWNGGVRDSLEAQITLAEAYEAAAEGCTSACAATATIAALPGHNVPPVGTWVTARAPARLDLAGSWADATPMCYSIGAHAVTLAVTVGARQPIGARARRLKAFEVRIIDCGGPPLTLTSLDDFAESGEPGAAGSLIKAALVTIGAIDLDGQPLPTQLRMSGGGYEIETWEELCDRSRALDPGTVGPDPCDHWHGHHGLGACWPESALQHAPSRHRFDSCRSLCRPAGSGLGTMPILASVVVASVAALIGEVHDEASLAHAVLRTEQRRASSGGWLSALGTRCRRIQPGPSNLTLGAVDLGWPPAPAAPTGSALAARPAPPLPVALQCETRRTEARTSQSYTSAGASVGGASTSSCPAALPLRGSVTRMPLATSVREALRAHLLLVYTGQAHRSPTQPRDTLRHWLLGQRATVASAAAAQLGDAEVAAKALADGDVPRLGRAMSDYWERTKACTYRATALNPASPLCTQRSHERLHGRRLH